MDALTTKINNKWARTRKTHQGRHDKSERKVLTDEASREHKTQTER